MGKKLSAYNLYMRKALKGKMTGKTKAQRKAIFKAAARGWNKGKPRSTSRSKPRTGGSSRSRSTTRRSNTTMGKRGGFNTQKIYKLIRMAAIALPAAAIVMGPGTGEQKLKTGVLQYFGYDMNSGTFRWEDLAKGWTPAVAAIAVTYGIPKLAGLIRGL